MNPPDVAGIQLIDAMSLRRVESMPDAVSTITVTTAGGAPQFQGRHGAI